VAQAVYLMARRLTPDWPRRFVAIGATAIALGWASPLAQVAVIAGGAVVGWLILRGPGDAPTRPEPSPISRRVGVFALVTFVALLFGLPVARTLDGQPLALVDSYFRAGSLVFGGGHVVLPLLHSSVVGPGWVTDDQFLAGYGAAQAVPGPLFTVAAYLGAVAEPAPNGLVGGMIALLAIFLPSFLLIFGTLPFWDWLRTSEPFRRALGGTNAAVVGLLVAALYTPIWTGAVTGGLDVAVVAAALAILLTDRVPPIVVVIAAALIGQAVGVRPG
jgi:chromate transporter